MREILFRGKRTDTGEWVAGSPWIFSQPIEKAVIIYGMGLIGEDDDVSRYCESYEVIPKSISEFVGIVDKNGKKIFEGDILKITDEFGNSVIWSVDCKNTAFSINQQGVNYSTYLGEFDTGRYDIEIIGNIYDTPELFEVKE